MNKALADRLWPAGFACHSLSLGFGDNENRDKGPGKPISLSLSLSLSQSLPPFCRCKIHSAVVWKTSAVYTWSGKSIISASESTVEGQLWHYTFLKTKTSHAMKEGRSYTHVEIRLSKKTALSFSVRWEYIQSELCGNARCKTNPPVVHKNDMFIPVALIMEV